MSLLNLPPTPAWVSVDTETSGLHWDDGARVACVSITWPMRDNSPELLTRAFPFDQGVRDKFPTSQLEFDFAGHGQDPNLGGDEWRELLAWLAEQRLLVFHNWKFDCHMLRVGTRHWKGVDLAHVPFWCTMLAQRQIDPTERAALDATMKRLGIGTGKTSLDVIKSWLKSNKYPPTRYDLAPWPLVEPYVTTDTEDTAHLYLYQQDRLASGIDIWDAQVVRAKIEREFRKAYSLYRMEERGIRYDDVASIEAAEKLEAMANEIEAGMPFTCEPTPAHNYFYGKLKLPPAMREKKVTLNGVSTKMWKEVETLDEEQVRQWKKDGVPWAAEFSDVTKYRRAVSMWYRGYPEKLGADGRLRTTYRQVEVKSGRMSVERVQLQAMPKKDKNIEGIVGVRELVLPEEGMGLWNLDLSQAELRVATKYSRCSLMADMLAKGMDIHGETTKQVIGVDPDDPLWKEKRDIAKRLNFGGIFQIGGKTFQATLAKLADIHLPLEECNQYTNGWRRMYPEFGVAYRRADQMAQKKRYVRVLPNTRYEIRSFFGPRDFSNTAWNRIVQGSLAEAFGIWLAEIEKRWPGYAVLTVHDSIILEAPLDEGDQIAAEVAEWGADFMTEVFNTQMTVDVDRW